MKKHLVISALMLIFSAPVFAAVSKNLKYFPEGERLTYTKLLEAYRGGKLDEVKKQRDIMAKNYPNSVHLDNAYYLSGMLELQSDHYGEAVQDFGVVSHRFVRSGKRPSAMFALGVTYQRLNLPKQAQSVFQNLRKEYPGSAESQRAWMQMRLADKGQPAPARPKR
jgi:TolA-binding protein